jgi:predicted site-specific integrase-resolvase
MSLVSYARVSTRDQNPALQREALAKVGCGRISIEILRGIACSLKLTCRQRAVGPRAAEEKSDAAFAFLALIRF